MTDTPTAEEFDPAAEQEALDAWAEFAAMDGEAAPAARDSFDEAAEVEAEPQPDAGEGGEEPAAEAEPAVPGETAPEPAAAEEPELDWTGVPETHRAAFERMAGERDKLSHRLKSDEGRVAGYQRKYEDLLRAAQPQREEGTRPTPAAALAAIKDEYPEIATPLEAAFNAMEGQVKTLSDAEEGRRMAAETELNDYLTSQAADLTVRHPDYLDVLGKNGERLVAWIDDQPRAVRDAFARNADTIVDAAEAATVIGLFKEHLASAAPAAAPAVPPQLSDRRQRQLASTAAPNRSTRRPAASGIPEEGDPQQIWDAIEAAERG